MRYGKKTFSVDFNPIQDLTIKSEFQKLEAKRKRKDQIKKRNEFAFYVSSTQHGTL